MQADLDAQEEARRKEMQARIDNMLRSAYVLPPLPVGVGSAQGVGGAPRIAPMIGDGPLRPTQAQIDAYYATGRGGVWDSVRGVFTTSPYGPPLPPEPPLPPPPPIPTYYDPAPPVLPPTMVPPPLQNLGEVLQRIQQKQPPEMPPVDPGFVIGPRESAGPIPTYYDPVPPMLAPPAQPSAGMDLSRLPTPVDPGFVMDIPTFRPPLPTPEPYTPPMAEPYTPPSMQFSVDMPRMDYARDLYGVIPDNVSMLKRGGLAVKPKKGKC